MKRMFFLWDASRLELSLRMYRLVKSFLKLKYNKEKKRRKVCLVFVFFTLCFLNLPMLFGATHGDSLEVGLMTCEPGSEVYSLYGHTAIRIKNYTTGEDWVFNYGTFSFRQPYFVWRFVRGECDYQIGAIPFMYFASEYRERGSSVYQQTINMMPDEKRRLFAYLLENMRPENREYRYNFLYDNCTTRARDVIENAIEGNVIYCASDSVRTYRRILHEYTSANYPWTELGNDICLGAGADVDINIRQEMFAPFYLLRYADAAVIRDSAGNERPFVLSKYEVVKKNEVTNASSLLPHPSLLVWLLVIVVITLTLVEYRRHLCFWWLDAIVMTLAGIIGVVVTFLFFFSVHPTVGSNWQIWVFNPLPLLAMPWVVWCAIKGKKTRYHAFNALVLIFFILFSPIIPQDFCVLVVPLALVLCCRSCSYIVRYKKETSRC